MIEPAKGARSWAQMTGRLKRSRVTLGGLSRRQFRIGDGPICLSGAPGKWYVVGHDGPITTLERLPWYARVWRHIVRVFR